MMSHLFVSPHPDDAILSCGGRIARLRRKHIPVTILTIFAGEAGAKDLSPLAKQLRFASGSEEEGRKNEDSAAAAALAAEWIHLPLPDAIYRRTPSGQPECARAADLFRKPAEADLPLIEQIIQNLQCIASLKPDFLHCCLGIGGHIGKLRILAIQDAARSVVGIAPLLEWRRNSRILTLVAGLFSDYGMILSARGKSEPVFQAVAKWFDESPYHRLVLREIPAESEILDFARIGKWKRLRVSVSTDSICPVLELPPDWQTYLKHLPAKKRYYAGSHSVKMMALHPLRFEILSHWDERTFTGCESLYRENRAQKEGIFNPVLEHPEMFPFLHNFCELAADRGWLRLGALYLSERLIAASINFSFRDRWFSCLKTYDPEWGRIRPGAILEGLLIQNAISEGARLFDFGRGEEQYKYDLGAFPRQNYLIEIRK